MAIFQKALATGAFVASSTTPTESVKVVMPDPALKPDITDNAQSFLQAGYSDSDVGGYHHDLFVRIYFCSFSIFHHRSKFFFLYFMPQFIIDLFYQS